MLAGLRGTLSSLVNAKYNAAKASQSLVFSATELVTIETEAGVPVSKPRLASIYISS